MTRECDRLREWLPEYAEGRLSGDARAAVEQHLSECSRCTQEVADLRALLAVMQSIPAEPVPENLVGDVRRAVARARTDRRSARGTSWSWSRLAVPAMAATGLLAAVLGYRLLEQGYEPRSLALSQAQRPAQRMARADRAPAAAGSQQPVVPAPPAAESRAAASHAAPPLVLPPPPAPLEAAPFRPSPAKPKQAVAAVGRSFAPSTQEPPRRLQGEPAGAGEAQEKMATPPTDGTALFGAMKGEAAAGGGARGGGRGAARGPSPRVGDRVPGWGGRSGQPRPEMQARKARGAAGKSQVAAAPAPESRALDQMRAPRPGAAHVLLTREGDRLALAIRLEGWAPGTAVEVKADGRPIWTGLPLKDQRVTVSVEGASGGPNVSPLTITSPEGTRAYTLFAPPFGQLGKLSGVAVRRYRAAPLSQVLAEMSAKGGIVLLVEGPLAREVSGELDLASPKAAVDTLAGYAGYAVRADGPVSYTLTPR